jgi:putative tryptophan/tyrosine transport system substrate-binding protein
MTAARARSQRAGLSQPDGDRVIDFYVDFEIRSRLLQKIIGMLFNEAVKRAWSVPSTNVELIAARARSDAEIEAVVTSLGGEPGGGLVVTPDYFMLTHRGPIILLAARNNVPTVYPWRSLVVRDGALLSYGPDLRDIVRRGAPYIDRILRGEKPADLPVQVPVKFEMAANAKTAKALGLTVPPSILLRADEVVE